MTKFIAIIISVLLSLGCGVSHAQNTPSVESRYINYTKVIKTWIEKTHKDKLTVHTVVTVDGDEDGTRYFTIELAYHDGNETVIEYHFLVVSPKGKAEKSKLLRTMRESDLEEELPSNGRMFDDRKEGET